MPYFCNGNFSFDGRWGHSYNFEKNLAILGFQPKNGCDAEQK